MNLNLNKKRIVIFSAAAVALAACIVLCVAVFRKPLVAFYGLNERQKNALLELKVFYKEDGKAKFRFVELNAVAPLEKELKRIGKPDLLFAFDGAQIEDSAILKKAKAVKEPISNDFLAFASDSDFTREFGLQQFSTLNDVERYLERCKKYGNAPLVFAGAENSFVLEFLGALCESVSGLEKYNAAAAICRQFCNEGKNNAFELVEKLCKEENSPLYETVQTLCEWRKKGYFSSQAFSMNYGDVFEYMREKEAPLVLLSLSARRMANKDFVKRYNSFYIPSRHSGGRAFTAPAICMVRCSKNRKVLEAAAYIALNEAQEIFSAKSGLAPVAASCQTADLQADDVRFWVASCQAPLAGLDKDGFSDASFARAVSNEFVKIIIN